MAMMDYGAIAFKNGKLLSKEMFGDMKEMVGWEDTEADVYHDYSANKDKPLNLKGEYFAYVGDSDCTLAFYKTGIVVVRKYEDGTFERYCEWVNSTYYTWSKWKYYVGNFNDKYSEVIVTKRNGYLVCKWKYKGDKYKVYFGYGVDVHWWLKWRVVNAYRTPGFIWRNRIVRGIKYAILDWKYR